VNSVMECWFPKEKTSDTPSGIAMGNIVSAMDKFAKYIPLFTA